MTASKAPARLAVLGELVIPENGPVSDVVLIAQGLPPVMCEVAQPETGALFRRKPVARS